MSAPAGQASPQGNGPSEMSTGPPYAPRTQSLGGVPDIMPDIPVTAVFLFFYVIMAPVHMTILKKNQKRGHKFIFNGAMFGFCMIRIVTMSLRIAWACHQTNINLAISAQVFVYVGTIILYLIDWFFTQRIVRAQHPRWGWSTPYRVLHRAGLVFLVVCLLMLVVAAIQQFFTLSTNIRRIDRDLQLTGQTYFAAFCFAPMVLVLISLILTRRGTEKFGAGRLRNNITILLIAVTILSIGQIFRCVTTWLTPVPLRTAHGQPLPTPWYFSKACFYTFNFTTEILVVMLYAIVRVDLRFYVPDGSKGPGDYSRCEDRYSVDLIGSEKNLKRASTLNPLGLHPNSSVNTLHEYESSIFDDTRTLADSLRYPSSVLEVDSKSGHWKIKRTSGAPSTMSLRHSAASASQNSLWSPDRETYVGDGAPPVPSIPAEWPLRDSQIQRGSVPVMEHHNHRNTSGGGSSNQSNEIRDHALNGVDMSNAIEDAMAKLEANSEARKATPPDTPVDKRPSDELPVKKTNKPSSGILKKHTRAPASASSDCAKSAPESSVGSSFEITQEEFKRFSYEAPLRRGDEGYEGSGSESEKDHVRRDRQR